MISKLKLDLEATAAEKLSTGQQVKVFAYALILVPIALCTHLFTAFIGIFSVPNTVIDIISLAEKNKNLARRKLDEQI